MSDETKGYLPPESLPNTHADYRYNEVQGAHRVGNSTIYGPPEAIVTVSSVAQRECERRGFEELPDDVVDVLLEADTAEETQSIVDDYRDGDAEYPVLDETVDEISDAIESGEFDDELDALEAAEADADDRAGVHDAIESRRDEILTDGDEGAGE